MRVELQFVTTPTADTPGTTVLLRFDQRRYLFGRVAEGTQRASSELGGKLAKISHVFLTGPTGWSTAGGLLSFIIGLADVTQSRRLHILQNQELKAAARRRRDPAATCIPEADEETSLTVHGARNLTHLVASARRFILRKGMPVRVNEIDDGLSDSDPGDTEPAKRARSASPPSRAHVAHRAASTREKGSPRSASHALPPTWMDERISVWAIVVRATPATGRSKSSRKRTHREVDGGADEAPTSPDQSASALQSDQERRQAVVADMFNSSWTSRSYSEIRLSDVPKLANPGTNIFVRNPDTAEVEAYTGPVPDGEANDRAPLPVPDLRVLVRKPWPGATVDELPESKPSSQSVCYLVRHHDHRGKFLVEKAIALKVPTGAKFSALTSGQSVVALDGTIVTPEMVMGPPHPGAGFAVVDLPSAGHVRDLIDRPEWRTGAIVDGMAAIVWILGPGVIHDHALQQFMRQRPSVKHLVASSDTCPNRLTFDLSAAATIQLHQIDPLRFGVPVHSNRLPVRPSSEAWPLNQAGDALFEPPERGMVIQLEPVVAMDRAKAVPLLNTADVWNRDGPELLALGDGVRNEIRHHAALGRGDERPADLPSPDAEIVTLGTGAMMPSRQRNVSATLLRVPGHGSYLFDCGEGTLGQLRRVFAADELAEILRDLKAIWISHLHADHHLGTMSVLQAWHREVWRGQAPQPHETRRPSTEAFMSQLRGGKTLGVIGDWGMIRWLEEFAQVEEFGHDRLLPLHTVGRNLTPDQTTRLYWKQCRVGLDRGDHAMRAAMIAALGVCDIQTVRVHHCMGAQAVTFTFPNGFKFSYSGDCRPSHAFAEMGQGSTVLVHEATFDDELHADAVSKKHSTTSEALAVAAAMRARTVLLTHFSQRYQKIPVMETVDGSDGARPLTLDDLPRDPYSGSRSPDARAVALPASDAVDDELPVHSGAADADAADADADVDVDDPPGGGGTAPAPGSPPMRIRRPKGMKVGVAFDYMRVKVGDIGQLESFTPAIAQLFAKDDD
ncbi:MAG: hypothetical protein M1826_007764 [Phylliscum demangeonii]|nr:MAG: hypothetical protein M1826_007764 [Phylliscum demangeonii]